MGKQKAIRFFTSLALATTLFFNPNIGFGNDDSDILDFLPGILATIERKPPPPPPPPPAQWRIINQTYCISGISLFTVSDGSSSRSSSSTSPFPDFLPVSASATVPPGERRFSWNLRTRGTLITCGFFSGSFTENLMSGYRYTFTLSPNNSGGVEVSTRVTPIN